MTIDIASHLGAVAREVTSREHQGQPARVLVATRTYPTSLADLWDALTNPERLPRWFLPVTGELRIGGHYSITGNASGTITACDPPHRFALTWEHGGRVSWVEVQLEPAAAATRLRLEHIAHVEDDVWQQYGPGAVGVGWELAWIGLALHIDSGGAVDPATFEAWSGGPEGKTLIRRSSEGWGEASIAGGTDTQQARDAAARTSAFYTGEPAPATAG